MKTFALIVVLVFGATAYGQSTKQQEARAKGSQAIKLMDNGEIEASITLLKEAQKLDPKNIDFPYEIGYALYLKKDYAGAIKQLKPLTKKKDAQDIVYQLLGNAYSLSGDRSGAIRTYEDGMKRYPNSGRLYLERGNMEAFVENYDEALGYFEKGIEVDPNYPSNYYWASKLYCHSSEEVFGMIYGEIFMNLERNTRRTEDISQLLHKTYCSELQIVNDSTTTVSFSKNATIYVNDPSDLSQFRMPFGIGVYEPVLLLSSLALDTIDIHTLNTVRTKFVEQYYAQNHHTTFPNVLFAYQKRVAEAGHLEAYNYWVLSVGNPTEFDIWAEANPKKWTSFMNWFTRNAIEVTDENKFVSYLQ
jgi:tetratricopeptide (TPR) repeat protein